MSISDQANPTEIIGDLSQPPGPAAHPSDKTSEQIFLEAQGAHAAGNLQVAEQGYRLAIERDAANADAIHLLGVLHAQRDQHTQAEDLIRRAIAIKDVWAYYDNLGKTLQVQGKLAEARGAFLRAAEFKPDHTDALSTAGFLSLELGDLNQAETIYRRILGRWPDLPVIHNNLANVYFQLNRHAEAEAEYRRSIELAPDYAKAHYNLAILLNAMMRNDEAILAYQNAIRCQPNYPEALNNLANLYLDLKQHREAEATYQKTLDLQPNLIEVITNLGNLYSEQKRYPEAEACYRRALSVNPELEHELVLLSYCKRQMCAWEGTEFINGSIRELLSQNTSAVLEPLQLFSEPGVGPEDQLRVGHKKITKDFANTLRLQPLVDPKTYRDKVRLRIGYLSADFHEHATMHLLLGVLEQRDVAQFETYLYSFGPNLNDVCRQRARNACERFIDIRSLSDKDAAELIARDGIDILVDLKGYTTDSRLGISAWRPAPVTVSWLGYPGTLGHPRMADYIIGDNVVTPVRHADHFSETLALMPHSYQPTDSQRVIGNKPQRQDVGLPENGFVFCSFNQAFKLNSETFSIWCRLLTEIPGSILWLLEHTPTARANLRKEAEKHGINPDRIAFALWASQSDHLGRLQLADLALDTYPYGSHTTGSDALWAGVPLISRMGNTFASRVSASLLHAIGLSELVANDWDDYFALAKRLASSPGDLAAIKSRLQANRISTPLFDTRRFSRNLERIYHQIWQQQQQGIRQPIILQP